MRVVEVLMDRPRCVHELMGQLDVEQSLLSHHQRVLREAGLVEGVRDGKSVRYRLTARAQVHDSAIDLGCCRLTFDSRPTRQSSRGARNR
jgi:DNA-binding transcriptional ArsR family regulator